MWPKKYRFPDMLKSITVTYYPFHPTAVVAREVLNRTMSPSVRKQYPELQVHINQTNDGKRTVLDFLFGTPRPLASPACCASVPLNRQPRHLPPPIMLSPLTSVIVSVCA